MAFRREIGATSALLITVGAMIGSGVFATPHDVARAVGSPALTLALWVAGGALALLGALSFAELGAAIPEAGGMYIYLRRAYGPLAAFVFGWAMLVVLVPSSMGFFAQVTARYGVGLFGGGRALEAPVAVAVVTVLVLVNLRGVRGGAAVQNAATVVKYAGIAALGALALWARPQPSAAVAAPTAGPLGVVAALVPVLWAYDGWIDITSIAAEVRDPSRNIPRSLVFGTALVTLLYLLANASYLRLLGPAGLAATETPAADAAARAVGAAGHVGVSVLVAVSTFGGCAVALLTGSRVVYAMAADGLFFRAFARTSARGVPDAAVAACGALAVVYVTSPLGKLGDLFVVGAWPFYAAGAIATIVLRRKEPGLVRPHRTVAYPGTIVVFAAVSVAIVVGYAAKQPLHTALSVGTIALGAPVYALARRRAASGAAAPPAGLP